MSKESQLLKVRKRPYIDLTVLTLKDIYIYLQLSKHIYSTFNSFNSWIR